MRSWRNSPAKAGSARTRPARWVWRDLDPADVLLLMGYLWRVAPDEDGIAQGRRLTRIVLDGIRTGRQARQDTTTTNISAQSPAAAAGVAATGRPG